MSVRFISDVHLGGEEWEKLARLKRALEGPKEIVLLGDVFEYWVGARQIEVPTYAALAAHLASLTRAGVSIEFVAGNRDFMVDRRFARATGVKLLGRTARRELGAYRTHLEHGDFLFNKNYKHAAYRRLERFELLREAVMDSPAWVLRAIGRSMRRISDRPALRWSEEDLLGRAGRIFASGVDALVCGHIHQPQVITREVGGKPRTLMVLGDWDGDGIYGEFDGRGFRLLQ
jgi:UDP-2,3-diacylglucosamine hydrolase